MKQSSQLQLVIAALAAIVCVAAHAEIRCNAPAAPEDKRACEPVKEGPAVQAKRAVNSKVVGRTSSGVPIADMSLTYGVSVAGLDLASSAGATELSKRVSDAAQAACKEISRQYPSATPGDAECAKKATEKAMAKVHRVIAAAQLPAK